MLKTFLNKRNKLPKMFPEYEDSDIDLILEEATESNLFEYKPVSNKLQISFVLIGVNGAYFFTQSKTENKREILEEVGKLKQIYHLPKEGAFIFVLTNENCYFISDLELVRIENIVESFENLYRNTLRPIVDYNYINFHHPADMLKIPEIPNEFKDEEGNLLEIKMDADEDETYVKPQLSQNAISIIEKILEESEVLEDEGKDTFIDKDGQKYRKFSVRTKLFGYSYRDEYYPIAVDDPKVFSIKTLLGGCFGLHKVIAGEYIEALFYFLTCGGFGVFYLFDLYLIATGNYSIMRVDYLEEKGKISKRKTKIYLEKLEDRKWSAILILLGIIIAYVSTKFIYLGILSGMNLSFARFIGNMVSNVGI